MEDDSEYDIHVSCETALRDHASDLLRRAVTAALKRLGATGARLSIAVVTQQRIAQLNLRYCRDPAATDVLSFDLSGDTLDQPGSGPVPAGQIEGAIAISIDAASRESESRGHDLTAELALYAVHGTLHLLGFDDHDRRQARRMHLMEDDILSSIGLGAVYGTKRTSKVR